MSESLSREQRRNLRRAMGAEAVGVLEQHSQALGAQVLPALHALDRRIATEEARSDQRYLDERQGVDRLTQATTRTADKVRDLEVFLQRGFWGRLKWVCLGR